MTSKISKTTEQDFKKGDVISIPVGDTQRPALITRIGGDDSSRDTSTVYYAFILADGRLDGGGHFRGQYEMKHVKRIDFAKVRTVVDLPPEWEKLAYDYEQQTGEEAAAKRAASGDRDPETHPSYGFVRVSRVSGHSSLFMSPFRHMHYMTLAVGRSTKHRSLGQDRQFGGVRGELVEIALSEAQWAHMVSSVGLGGGVPCTLRYVGAQKQADCPEQQEIERFQEDVELTMKNSAKFLLEAEEAMRELAEDKAPSKEKRKAALGRLVAARRQLDDSAPFIARQLRERMATIVQEGKTEIEAYAHNTLIEGGIAALAETLGKSPQVLDTQPLGFGAPPEKLVEGESTVTPGKKS